MSTKDEYRRDALLAHESVAKLQVGRNILTEVRARAGSLLTLGLRDRLRDAFDALEDMERELGYSREPKAKPRPSAQRVGSKARDAPTP